MLLLSIRKCSDDTTHPFGNQLGVWISGIAPSARPADPYQLFGTGIVNLDDKCAFLILININISMAGSIGMVPAPARCPGIVVVGSIAKVAHMNFWDNFAGDIDCEIGAIDIDLRIAFAFQFILQGRFTIPPMRSMSPGSAPGIFEGRGIIANVL